MTITILDVMSFYTGDFSIRTLVAVSRCSKLANQTTKPQIDRMTRDTPEMRQLVRIFSRRSKTSLSQSMLEAVLFIALMRVQLASIAGFCKRFSLKKCHAISNV
jgi:hypothetical protein